MTGGGFPAEVFDWVPLCCSGTERDKSAEVDGADGADDEDDEDGNGSSGGSGSGEDECSYEAAFGSKRKGGQRLLE